MSRPVSRTTVAGRISIPRHSSPKSEGRTRISRTDCQRSPWHYAGNPKVRTTNRWKLIFQLSHSSRAITREGKTVHQARLRPH